MKKAFLHFCWLVALYSSLCSQAQTSVTIEPTATNGIFAEYKPGLTWSSNDTSNPPTAPTSGAGTRLMWIPSRSAFRVGTAESNEWDASEIGLFSVGMGFASKAKGKYSMATGIYAAATGDYAVAIGNNTYASGESACTLGNSTIALGRWTTAIGVGSKAMGEASTAMGYYTIANGENSTAIGYKTNAKGDYSTAMGNETTASGLNSIAMGDTTTASGESSTAMGYRTIASGERSTAMGGWTIASGYRSTAMGAYSEANGDNSLAWGYLAKANGYTSVALGSQANTSNNYTVAIGNSCLSVADNAIVIGNGSIANGIYSTAMGFNASTNGKIRSFAIGGHSSNANPQVANTADYQMMMAFHNYRFWTQTIGAYVDFGPNGEVTATGPYTNVSDRRLKRDFRPLTASLVNLTRLNTYHYYWKTDSTSKELQTGVIAQELREIFPELVHEDDKGMLSVNYVGLVPHLIEAVKELKAENELWQMRNQESTTNNAELSGRLTKMEERLNKMEVLLKANPNNN